MENRNADFLPPNKADIMLTDHLEPAPARRPTSRRFPTLSEAVGAGAVTVADTLAERVQVLEVLEVQPFFCFLYMRDDGACTVLVVT